MKLKSASKLQKLAQNLPVKNQLNNLKKVKGGSEKKTDFLVDADVLNP